MRHGRRPGAKDKSKRSRGSHKRFHDEVKARHASYPPLGNVHMNSGIPMEQESAPVPEAMMNPMENK